MIEMKIDISDLKTEDGDLVKELSKFVKEKTEGQVETTTTEIIIKGEEKPVSKTYLRVLLRKFLHKQELKEIFRVVGGKENALIIKEIKIKETEEEE